MTDVLQNIRSRRELDSIRTWFQSELGVQVLQTQTAILEQLLGGFFGYHLLQVSVQQQSLFDASPINHKITLGLTDVDASPLIAKPTALPFESDCIDVALLHHMLDYVDSPQDVLREISRVVLPMGHVVIVGFNPISLWGLWKPFASFRGNPPWNGQFIRPDRLMDWLNLLNFRIDRATYCQYRLPIAEKDWVKPDYSKGLSRRANWPVGGVYVIVARKHVGTMTPLRPIWTSRKAFGRLSAVQPASRDVLSRNDVDSPSSE